MKKIPQRMCVSCRKRANKSDLMRVVMMADGQVLIDGTGKKPGRGAYVCKNKDCLNQAIKAHRFERGLKTDISSEVINELLNEANKLCDTSEEQ